MPDHLHVVPDESSANEAKAPPPWQRPIAATFGYADEHGEVLYQSVKFADDRMPRFMQRHPNGQGGWKWGIEGISRILYRLPELTAALANDQTIYVVEGEKDVESLRALGLVATTNPMGAGKWRPEYSETLRGADVVIIGDNDGPGSRHVEQVAAALHGIAKRVRVPDLAKHWPRCPHKGDISDWLVAGGTADELTAVVDASPEWKPQSTAAPAGAWPVMSEKALHGLVGDVVQTIDPHTEADPNAILLQFLIVGGALIGRKPFIRVDGSSHYPKLFCVLVGATSKGRKGTSLDRIREIVAPVDPTWVQKGINSGLASGEGLISHVRDATSKVNKDGVIEEIDPGVADKRLLVVAEEFAGVLSVIERPGNTLSPVIRDAWGPNVLQTMTKNSPMRATDSHVTIIGHVTDYELKARLSRTEIGNGFANRFLFAKVKRSKVLPHGGNLPDAEIHRLGQRIKKAIEAAQAIGRVTMTKEAAEEWEAVYPALSADRPGMLGAVLSRAEAQVVRIAMIYAVLDNSTAIGSAHLQAALAVWEYCEESARQIFGDALGDPIADTILAALRAAGPGGKSRNELLDLFSRNQSSSQIRAALALLVTHRYARSEAVRTAERGRQPEMWFAIDRGR
jgi:hypothetical protein